MTDIRQLALKRIDNVIGSVTKDLAAAEKVRKEEYPYSTLYQLNNPGMTSRLCSLLLSTITDLSPKGSAYIDSANLVYKTMDFVAVVRLSGILRSLRSNYVNGHLTNLNELIDADLFSDILAQAEYLLSKKFYRASAVVTGVALEEHLRKLVKKHKISLPEDRKYIKAEYLNDQLAKNEVYDITYHKSITAWTGLRNDSAHPTKEIDNELVKPMIEGVRVFINTYPA